MNPRRDNSLQLYRGQDAHWTTVSRATQLQAAYRVELRRRRAEVRRRRLRLGVALWLVRFGLRLAGPLTIEKVLSAN